MSGAGFHIFNEVFSDGAELLYAICLTLFLRPFMMEQGHWLRKCVIVFSVYIFGSRLYEWTAAPQGTFSLLIIVLLVAVSKALGLEKAGLSPWPSILGGENMQRPDSRKPVLYRRPFTAISDRPAGGTLLSHCGVAFPSPFISCCLICCHALCLLEPNEKTASAAWPDGDVLYEFSTSGRDYVWTDHIQPVV